MEFNSQYVRDPEDYPDALKFTLEQLTINEIPKVVGSTAYIQHKYPSDVDVFENVIVNMNKNDAALFYANEIQNIVKKVIVNDDLFLADFKIGFDPIYNVNLDNSSQQSRIDYTKNLYDNKYINEVDYNNIIDNSSDIDNFYLILRQYKLLRWTPNEIIEGKKKLTNNREILLYSAIEQDSLIKMDVITWVVNRYLSIEIFFLLSYAENNTIILFHPLGNYKDSLSDDVKKYSISKYYNPLKVAKRLWSLSRISNCSDLMNVINPLLNSDAAALNQVRADIETISILLNKNNERKRKLDISRVFLSILGFSKRIANHSFNILMIELYINNIFNQWTIWKNTGILNIENISDNLIHIDNILKNDIIDKSKDFINTINTSNIICNNINKKIIL